jgi:short-subunit dehydrogenase
VRKDETQREGSEDEVKVEVVNSGRVRTGGVGRDGDGGRDGERRWGGEDDAE